MGLLKLIRDFRAPTDEATAAELRRQLGQLEQNVSDMGDRLAKGAMQRLAKQEDSPARDNHIVLAPGQFQQFDTRAGDISTTLAKPTAADAGTFIVVIDLGGGASNLFLRAASGCTVDETDHVLMLAFASLLFCDGENYWRLI